MPTGEVSECCLLGKREGGFAVCGIDEVNLPPAAAPCRLGA